MTSSTVLEYFLINTLSSRPPHIRIELKEILKKISVLNRHQLGIQSRIVMLHIFILRKLHDMLQIVIGFHIFQEAEVNLLKFGDLTQNDPYLVI